MPCRATQEQVMMESSDKTCSTGEGNAKPLVFSSCLLLLRTPKNSKKRKKDRTMKDELARSVATQYATGDLWRNNSKKNEETEPKQKQYPVVGMTGDGNKV